MPTFVDFRDGSGGETLSRMGVDIGKLRTWGEYRATILALPDRLAFLERAKRVAAACSPTERVVVAASLFAADFAWLAVELDGGDFWNRVSNFDSSTGVAVAAAIIHVDA